MRTSGITKRLSLLGALAVSVSLLLLVAAAPASAAGPAWRIDSLSNPTSPGIDDSATPLVKENEINYFLQIRNVGDESTSEPYKVTATFSPGLKPVAFSPGFHGFQCNISPPAVTCEIPGDQIGLGPDGKRRWSVTAEVITGSVGQTTTASFEVTGGNAGSDSFVDATRITGQTASFGIGDFDAQASANPKGSPFSQAAGHPYAIFNAVEFNSINDETQQVEYFGEPGSGDLAPVAPPKDVVVDLPPGLIGNPGAVDQCTADQLANSVQADPKSLCPPASQVGTTELRYSEIGVPSIAGPIPVYNMVPPTGSPAQLGFNALGNVVVLNAKLRSDSDYGVSLVLRNITEGLNVQSTNFNFWGVPGDGSHTPERACPAEGYPEPFSPNTTCTADSTAPFLRFPTACTKAEEGVEWRIAMASWFHPGAYGEDGSPDLSDPNWKQASFFTHEPPGYPAAPDDWGDEQGPEGCDDVPVDGTLNAQPTSIDTETSSGLNVHVEVPNPGLENAKGIASSDIKAVTVELPEGVTVNPSQAEGLGACAPGQYQSTRLEFHPDGQHGCPSNAKIGSVLVHTPLLEETIPGDVYIAQPYDNPFGSLLALYVVLHNEQRGILVKLAGEVETNETTGQITAKFNGIPQVPFSSFDFKFREGARAPLVTPPACGKYTTHAEFTGWSDPTHHIDSNSFFEIVHGIGGGPCPSGGLPPFKPGLNAGTLNNLGGAFSPFNLRLFRTDAEQEFTNFSIKLPPGLLGKLAGVSVCSDAAILSAKAANRRGAQETASPSCPSNSEVGRTLVGAGVGSVQGYVPGRVYLAGPYNGAPLSLVSITAAKVGPFDLGTVVVRLALRVNPVTAEVFVDPTGSDPIPHIIDGITTHIRDIRAYVDRPEFMINPTSCDETSIASTLLGSGLDFSSALDDLPVTVTTRFQAASCERLPFEPKTIIRLKGATRRAGNPALTVRVVEPKLWTANASWAQTTLPRSEFLDNAHIGTVCTRVDFKQGAIPGEKCPADSIYGRARVLTPLLDEVLAGPVYLRSNPEHKLPDLVIALHSPRVDFELAGRIDSVKGGRIRATFETIPDAYVKEFVLEMKGGNKGLLENSANLCRGKHRAEVKFDSHNGKTHDSRPVIKVKCGGRKGKKDNRRRRAAAP